MRAGRAEPFPEHTRRLAPSVNLAWEHRLDNHLNLVLQVNSARSVFEDGADAELTATVLQASLGLRRRFGEFVVSCALTENLVTTTTRRISVFTSDTRGFRVRTPLILTEIS